MSADPINGRLVWIRGWTWRARADEDAFVTRTISVDTRKLREHPFADRAEGIVSKGIHGGVLAPAKAMVFGVAIPAFPNGSGALVDLVSPGRKFPALQQAHRQIVLAGS